MTAHFSKKTSWLRCFTSFLPAIGVAALLCALLDGPRLGPFYDFLLKLRPALPISGELLIIDSSVSGSGLGDDILEPGAAASLLYTMAEMGARTLIIQVPILGLSAGGNTGEEEILSRFDEEFSILSRNIRNLFDAIRLGSVAPNESARYVGELVELSEKGKERLVSALVRRDEAGVISMENAAAFFGHARRPGDLRVQLIRSGEAERPGVLAERDEYSKAQSDRDGVVRRIAPVMYVPEVSEAGSLERTVEHIIYAALKTRFETSGIQSTENGLMLIARNGQDGTDRIIPLDRSGALLFEVPYRWGGFRRIGISDFLAYDEADRSLRRILLDAETLGIFDSVNGEDNPGILYDYALSVREEPASSFRSDEEKKSLWIDARNRYFASLEDFLLGPTEMNLVRGYEEIIASEFWDGNNQNNSQGNNSQGNNSIEETALVKMIEMRDSLIGAFAALRAKHDEVLELRKKLETALSSSFCILGNTPDVEISALLANSILTGRAIKPGANRHLFLGAVISALVVCLLVKSLGPVSTLGAGAVLSLLFGIGFSVSFIFSGLWLDPLVPAAACGIGVLVSAAWALIAGSRYSRQFRQAFGPFVSGPCLKSVIRAGRPLPSQVLTTRAAIVAIKNAAPPAPGDTPAQRTRALLSYQEKAAELIKKAGGTITGMEEDLVTASFGSPLERIFLKGQKAASPYENNINANAAPALKAVDFVSDIAKRPDCKSWHFGLDTGNCTFAWTALSGYAAIGAPVQKARVLARLADRYSSQVLISASASEALSDLAVKKLDVIKGKDGGEAFYRLAVG